MTVEIATDTYTEAGFDSHLTHQGHYSAFTIGASDSYHRCLDLTAENIDITSHRNTGSNRSGNFRSLQADARAQNNFTCLHQALGPETTQLNVNQREFTLECSQTRRTEARVHHTEGLTSGVEIARA